MFPVSPVKMPSVSPNRFQGQQNRSVVLFEGRKAKGPSENGFSPIEAVAVDFSKLELPVILSPKVDGNRGIIQNGKVIGRSLLPVPNPTVQKILGRPELEGFDGELVASAPTDPDACNKATSFLQKKYATPADFAYYVFDVWNEPDKSFEERLGVLKERYKALPRELKKYVKLMPQVKARSVEQILKQEKEWLDAGYEGVVIRNPKAQYLNQRSTMSDQAFMKLKRFEDAEALITDFRPLKARPALVKSLVESGELTQEQAQNLKTIEALGGYRVKDLKTQAEFNLGTGKLTFEQRVTMWKNRLFLLGKTVKYKFFPKGVNPKTNVPRHPIFLGFRADHDLPASLRAIADKFNVTNAQGDDEDESAA